MDGNQTWHVLWQWQAADAVWHLSIKEHDDDDDDDATGLVIQLSEHFVKAASMINKVRSFITL